MATKIKLGNGQWGVKENGLLAYNDEDGIFKAIEMDFSRASDATRESSAGLIAENKTGVPRIDFSDSSDGALLLEPQSTNLCLTSEDFSDANWAKFNATISSNSLTSPKGDLTADKFIEDGTTNNHFVQDAFTLDGTSSYSFSVFAKASGRTWIKLDSASNGNWSAGAFFDLQNGFVGTIDSGSAKIEDYGNGWYRCSISGQSNVATTGGAIIQLSTDGSTTNYAGDGTSGVYLWGGQIEALSYPTSYIKTSGATATRIAESCSKTGLENYINSSEGVLYFEGRAIADDSTIRSVTLCDNTTSNRVTIRYGGTSNEIEIIVAVGGVLQVNTSTNVVNIQYYSKFAFHYKENDFKLYFNGLEVLTDTSGSVFTSGTLNTLIFNNGVPSGSGDFFGKVKDLRVYDVALTDSELQNLTTL